FAVLLQILLAILIGLLQVPVLLQILPAILIGQGLIGVSGTALAGSGVTAAEHIADAFGRQHTAGNAGRGRHRRAHQATATTGGRWRLPWGGGRRTPGRRPVVRGWRGAGANLGNAARTGVRIVPAAGKAAAQKAAGAPRRAALAFLQGAQAVFELHDPPIG